MEKLMAELEMQICNMNEGNHSKYNLSGEVLDNLYSVFPFNKFEYMMSHLLATDTITLKQYLDIRNSYLERNKYLYVFEITAPRTFGKT